MFDCEETDVNIQQSVNTYIILGHWILKIQFASPYITKKSKSKFSFHRYKKDDKQYILCTSLRSCYHGLDTCFIWNMPKNKTK